jgi:uncharacterized protein (UPF0332 family)
LKGVPVPFQRVSYDGLMAAARALIDASVGQQDHVADAMIRRAVSTAYYAVFHNVCDLVQERLLSGGPHAWQEELRQRAYRTLDHKTVVAAARRLAELSASADAKSPSKRTPPALVPSAVLAEFCSSLLTAYEARLDADYNPARLFTKVEAEQIFKQAQISIMLLDLIAFSPDHQRLVAELLTRPPRTETR